MYTLINKGSNSETRVLSGKATEETSVDMENRRKNRGIFHEPDDNDIVGGTVELSTERQAEGNSALLDRALGMESSFNTKMDNVSADLARLHDLYLSRYD